MADIARNAALDPAGASALIAHLRNGMPRTRAELAAVSGLGRSTITTRVASLLETGLLAPVGDAASTGGRPPAQFALNPAARVIVAADFGATHATIALTNLTGTILHSAREELEIGLGPATVLTRAVEVIDRLLAQSGRNRSEIAAVGIGLPGPVEHETGRPSNPPIMPGWDAFDVPTWMQQHLPVPVLVDNDVNIMALGERATVYPSTNHLLFVKVSTGIGAGVISGGALQRGARGIAGDLGHVRVPRGAGINCRCGNTGCLEAIASGPAIAASLSSNGIAAKTTRDVVTLVRQGDVDAIRAVRQAGRDLGEVLLTCVSLINPSVIVIGGSLADTGEHLLAGAREVVYSQAVPLATEDLAIVPSRTAENAAVLGAAAMAIEHAFSPAGMEVLTNS